MRTEPEAALVAPLSTVSSSSSSTERKSVEEYGVRLHLPRDGRMLLPISLAHGDHLWKVEVLVDTGATISIVAERELEWFSQILQDKHKMTPPRGGFFRMIRIRKTNLSGPFQSKIAYAYNKAYLELGIKLSEKETDDFPYCVRG